MSWWILFFMAMTIAVGLGDLWDRGWISFRLAMVATCSSTIALGFMWLFFWAGPIE